MLLCGCSEADKANYNIAKQADYFESERKITVYNARTDTIVMEAEGYMSISNNDNDELVCTVKIGPDQYKVNYIYLKRVHDVCRRRYYRHAYRPIPLQTVFPRGHTAQRGSQAVNWRISVRMIFMLVGCLAVMAVATILIVTAILSILLLIDFIRNYW